MLKENVKCCFVYQLNVNQPTFLMHYSLKQLECMENKYLNKPYKSSQRQALYQHENFKH